MYQVRRSYWKHNSSTEFTKKFFEVKDYEGSDLKLCMLQYSQRGDEEKICVSKPHGNSEQSTGYVRTKKSVKDKMCHEVSNECSTTSKVFDDLFDNEGGVMGTQSLGSIPRGKRQISDFKGAMK
jgi:hypothetical protein